MTKIDIREITSPTDFLCIYHGNCVDGFSGAWTINEWGKKYNHAIEFHAGFYGEENPPINKRHVILVDFSYPEEQLINISKFAKSITILDHHKTAQDTLNKIKNKLKCSSMIVFDLSKSGSEIAWNFFFKYTEIPYALKHVADRDLWKFEMQNTKEISAAIFSYEYTFEKWDWIMDRKNYPYLLRDGIAIERKHMKDVKELFNAIMVPVTIQVDDIKYTVPSFNVPYFYASELNHYALQQIELAPFSISYFINSNGKYNVSFRSLDNKIDVSSIAKYFGGGGHKNSAGCIVNTPFWK